MTASRWEKRLYRTGQKLAEYSNVKKWKYGSIQAVDGLPNYLLALLFETCLDALPSKLDTSGQSVCWHKWTDKSYCRRSRSCLYAYARILMQRSHTYWLELCRSSDDENCLITKEQLFYFICTVIQLSDGGNALRLLVNYDNKSLPVLGYDLALPYYLRQKLSNRQSQNMDVVDVSWDALLLSWVKTIKMHSQRWYPRGSTIYILPWLVYKACSYRTKNKLTACRIQLQELAMDVLCTTHRKCSSYDRS